MRRIYLLFALIFLLSNVSNHFAATKEYFGSSVGISGNYAVVGAPQCDASGVPASPSVTGKVYIYEIISATWKLVKTINGTTAGDCFGKSVAISGNYIVIGANKAVSGQGNAYIYERASGSWNLKKTLTASDAAAGDQFGISVSISGDYVIVGAHQAEPTGGTNQGQAYIFERNSSTNNWVEKNIITTTDGVSNGNEQFGQSVAISSNGKAVVGAVLHDEPGKVNIGSAYLFERQPIAPYNWTQTKKLIDSTTGATNDVFGASVAIDGNTVVVGAFQADGTKNDQGAAYVFDGNNGWSQSAKLVSPAPQAGDNFGYSVGISGKSIVVGAYYDEIIPGSSNPTTGNQGVAYYFDGTSGSWNHQATVTGNPTGATVTNTDVFGSSVAISGIYSIVGAPLGDVGSNVDEGRAYFFATAGANWSQKQELSKVQANPPPQPQFSISNYSNLFVNPTDVYFVYEHPIAKWVIVAGYDYVNFKNVVKRINPNGSDTPINLPKCKATYYIPPSAETQLTVRAVTYGGDLIITGQFDRCETFLGDPYPLGTPGIVKVKANGQVDTNFTPDFYPAGSQACQPVMPPANRKYCQPINFQAIYAFDTNGFVFVHGNFSSINGAQLPATNLNNLVKLNGNTGQRDVNFNAPNIIGTVKGIAGGANSGGYNSSNNINVWGDFTAGASRKNLMALKSDGSIDAQFNPGINIDGPINSIGSQPYPGNPSFAAGNFSKYKGFSNYTGTSPLILVKNLVYVGEDYSASSSGYKYISWDTVTPFEIVSMDVSVTSKFVFCAGGNNNSLVCFIPGYLAPNNTNNNVTPITPIVTSIPVAGDVKVVFNAFGTNDFYVGGSFGLMKINFTY